MCPRVHKEWEWQQQQQHHGVFYYGVTMLTTWLAHGYHVVCVGVAWVYLGGPPAVVALQYSLLFIWYQENLSICLHWIRFFCLFNEGQIKRIHVCEMTRKIMTICFHVKFLNLMIHWCLWDAEDKKFYEITCPSIISLQGPWGVNVWKIAQCWNRISILYFRI